MAPISRDVIFHFLWASAYAIYVAFNVLFDGTCVVFDYVLHFFMSGACIVFHFLLAGTCIVFRCFLTGQSSIIVPDPCITRLTQLVT